MTSRVRKDMVEAGDERSGLRVESETWWNCGNKNHVIVEYSTLCSMRQLLHCPPSPSCLSFTLAVSQTQQHCSPLVLPICCVHCVTNTMAASLVAILPAHRACRVTNTMTTSPVAVLPTVKTRSTLELSPECPEISVRRDFGFSDSEGSAAPLSSLCPGFRNAEITWG